MAPLYPELKESFPTDGEPRIEKRIHQTWKGTMVNSKVANWIKSWMVYHPDYEYYLWTDESVRQLITDKYPQLLPVFDNYLCNICRADALRYIILYEYGGIYADIDMESLKSMEPVMRKYSCILAQEPYEHSYIQGNFKQLVINALMACRKGHPFMKEAVDKLEFYSHMWQQVDKAGPHYLTSIYKLYNKEHSVEPTNENGVYLAPPEYFIPTVEDRKFFVFYYYCSTYKQRTKLQKQACVHLKLHGARKQPTELSFTNHHWMRTYSFLGLRSKSQVDIHSLIPNVKIYKS